MSSSNFKSTGRGTNFNDNDDVDDFAFLNHPRQGSSGYLLGDAKTNNEWEEKRRQLLEERKEVEERTLQSSKVALGLLHETEAIGVETAENLVKQREQLNNVEEKLDLMNTTLRVSQKHLTSMKSIFGGFKNYFSKSEPQANAKANWRPAEREKSKLDDTIRELSKTRDAEQVSNNHPALAHRGIDTSGFKLSFDEEEQSSDVATGSQPKQKSGHEIRSQQIERQLESNLSDIDLGVGRLKQLALGLGDEIESQNSLLDRLDNKIDRSVDSVTYQNRQMRQILK